ncbi:MAG: autotransporter outer membrane beta-barrel domain-containing protein, partial [Syntrophobacteraceae bacterium]
NFTATMVGMESNIADPGITITAVRNYTNSALTLTQNQLQVGNLLNKVSGVTTGDLGTVLSALDSIPASNANAVAGAYQQISPDAAASLANLGFTASAFFRQDLSERITSLRYAGPTGEIPAKFGAASPVNGWSFYADPQVFWGSQSSTAQESGYDFTMGGLTAGADYRVRDDLLVGVASGYGHTDAGLYNNLGKVQNDTVPVNLYAAYFPGCFYAFGSAGYATNLFSTNRQLVFGSIDREAQSSTTGNQFNGYAEAGYDLKVGGAVISPMASLAYSSLWIDGFGESGAGSLDLNVGSQHADSLQLGPGVRLATTLQYGTAVVAPQFYASYEHEFSNDSRTIDASLAGLPLSFQTQRLGADFGVIGGSITMFSGKNFSVRLDSNAEIGRSHYDSCMVDAGLHFRF